MVSEVKPLMSRADRAMETREQIIKSGREVFLEKGYHASSLDLVARVAGYTKGAVYTHFRNKADLFFAIHELALQKRLKSYLKISSKDPLEVAITLVDDWFKSKKEDQRWWLLLAEFRVHVKRDSKLTKRYNERHDIMINTFGNHLEELLEMSNGKIIAVLLSGMGIGMALEGNTASKIDRESFIKTVQFVLEGLK